MGKVKEINIKNQTYYFLDNIINIKNFHPNLLKIDKKSHKDDCENIHSVNLLYLIFHSATGHFKEENGQKYLILDSTEKYEEVFSGIKISNVNNNY